jgi:GntR family transcriptional regulator
VRVIGRTVTSATHALAASLDVPPEAPLLKLERVRSADNEPIVLEVSYLPLTLMPGLDTADFDHRSLYHVLWEDYGRYVATASETLEPVILTPREATLLGVSRGSPALLFRRTTRDRAGVIVELGEGLLRGDRSRFLIERQVREGWATEPATTDEASLGNEPSRIAASLLAESIQP